MPHTVVVGAGVFGVWTAVHLWQAGHDLTIVDAYGPANSRSSSGDESRIIRFGYGADEVYSRMARRSADLWRELADAAGAPALAHWCGVLWLSGSDTYTEQTRRTLVADDYGLEALDQATLRRRYPHLSAADLGTVLLETRSGVVMSRRAVQALAARLAAAGARVIRGRVLLPVGESMDRVRLADGSDIAGDAFVFACGAWLPQMFPEVIGDRIRPTRQVVIYFGAPAGDSRFGPEQTPAWVDFASGIYGVPDLEGRGVKVGIDVHGVSFDPDTGNRVLDESSLARARAWLGRRFPDLAQAPVVESRVCQYENTATGDFLIDRHPQHRNVVIVGGGSGHGFKHGPVVGELAARLALSDDVPQDRFALASKRTTPQRAVY